MYWDIVEVKPEAHLTLIVRFEDGLSGKVQFSPNHLTGVFSPLNEIDFFKKVSIVNGVVTWPGEIDLAPDAMYDEIKKHGKWVLN